jgi:hypothetical protein
MMAGPIALTLAKTIDKQVANAVILQGCNRYCHRGSPQQFIW